MKTDNLQPISHATLTDHYRVPLQRLPPEYKVFVGAGFTRMFDETSIPDYVKSKITMADAASVSTIPDYELYETDLFIYKGNGLGDVAWRASDTMYIVVLDKQQLTDMRGKHDDTGS